MDTMIYELIEDSDLDVLAITETWLTPDESVSAGCITPATNCDVLTESAVSVVVLLSYTRRASRRANWSYRKLGHLSQWVCMLAMTLNRFALSCYVVLINKKHGFTVLEFLDTMAMDKSNLLIAGDFNIHMDEGSAC